MGIDLKTKVGEATYLLHSPFHKVDGCALRAVWRTVIDADVIALQLKFDLWILSVAVDPTDDTINLSLAKSPLDEAVVVSHLYPWSQLIGKRFGWGWLGINQQGYLDGVSFSFESIVPQYSITVVASSLRLARIEEIAAMEQPRLSSEPRYEPAAKYA